MFFQVAKPKVSPQPLFIDKLPKRFVTKPGGSSICHTKVLVKIRDNEVQVVNKKMNKIFLANENHSKLYNYNYV